MTFREIVSAIFTFLLYVLLQLLIARNIILFDFAFCFIYIGSILLLPPDMSRTWQLLLAFLVGILVDSFYNTLGIHAAATVLLAYLRPLVLTSQVELPISDTRPDLKSAEIPIGGIFRYILLLTLIHHTLLFLLEAASFHMLVPTLVRIGASTLFTTVSILIAYFFTRR